MTTYATFINGCERVVSQIIRSPGVYFEKNKNQKTNQFKRKSTDINKLRSFIPSGEAFISEFDLFSSQR
jgi:DNA-directed RNA polymerase beta subunit